MLTMPATSSAQPPRLREWIERGLKANGHPPLATIVRAARAGDQPTGWRSIAEDISTRSGETVSHEAVRQWFTDDTAE